MASTSSNDIRLLHLDAIAEGADAVAVYAAGAVDAALDSDIDLLECALRCMVASVNATLVTWREMRAEKRPIGRFEPEKSPIGDLKQARAA